MDINAEYEKLVKLLKDFIDEKSSLTAEFISLDSRLNQIKKRLEILEYRDHNNRLKGNIPEVKTQLENLDKLKSVWNNPRLVRIDELTHDKPDRRIIIKISKGIIYYTDERNYAETKMMIRFAHNHNINLELSKLAWENHLINKKGCQEN